MTKAILYFDNKNFCPVKALNKWIQENDLKDGKIFNISEMVKSLIYLTRVLL